MDPLRTKRFFLAGVAIGVVAMSATGLAAARLIESPAQLAARSAAPATSVITGVARMRILSDDIVVAGVVRAGRTVNVTASAPYASVVVTKMPARSGGRVRVGQVIAEIDGRPIVLLRGTLPAYRDLREGDSGPDVAQLQAALVRLGYADFDQPGSFGPGTADAVGLLYGHLGYSAPTYRPPAKKHVKHPPPPTAYLPMSEVSFIPAASALVVSLPARVGSEVTPNQVVLRLAVGKPYVTTMLSAHQANRVSTGIPARIALSNTVIDGVIARISAIPAQATRGEGQPEYPVVVTSKRPLSQGLIGSAVRLTLTAPVTNGPVLAVPLTAIFSHAARTGPPRDPSTFVVLVAAKGRRRQVPVATGAAAGGFVAVQPAISGALRPGDHVLIGVGR
ncbi:MAG TPA: peptidoglycan-binding protein [Streptosporangiaceae bacterium]|nr:peptidoglycan-binding protein [Streptosporangiaceae bacterium]